MTSFENIRDFTGISLSTEKSVETVSTESLASPESSDLEDGYDFLLEDAPSTSAASLTSTSTASLASTSSHNPSLTTVGPPSLTTVGPPASVRPHVTLPKKYKRRMQAANADISTEEMKCMLPGCPFPAEFGDNTENMRVFCNRHGFQSMRSFRRRSCTTRFTSTGSRCNNPAYYIYPKSDIENLTERDEIFCSRHRPPGTVNINLKCLTIGCEKIAEVPAIHGHRKCFCPEHSDESVLHKEIPFMQMPPSLSCEREFISKAVHDFNTIRNSVKRELDNVKSMLEDLNREINGIRTSIEDLRTDISFVKTVQRSESIEQGRLNVAILANKSDITKIERDFKHLREDVFTSLKRMRQ